MPPSPKENTLQSPVTTNIVALQSRQSPNPPTARLAQLSDPPDKDPNGPKRVVVLCELYKNQHPRSQHCQSQPEHMAMAQTVKQYTTMAHSTLTRSYSPRHRVEPEEAPGSSQSIIPEETMDMPTSPMANRTSIALAKRRIILDKLCINITKNIHNMYRITSHNLLVQQTVKNSPQLSKLQSMLYLSSTEELLDLIQPAVEPLLQCIDRHHNKLKTEQYQLIIQHTNKTYQTISNDPILGHEAGHQLQVTIRNLCQYLKDHQPNIIIDNTNDTREPTVTEPTHNTANNRELNIHNNNGDNNPTPQQNKKSVNNRKAKKDRTTDDIHTPQVCHNPNCYQCVVHNIVNLSDTQLTRAQVMVLNRGLSFVPTATDAKSMEIIRDFNIFANKSKRKLRKMINPPRPPRPGDEPALFRNPNDTSTITDSQTLGPKVLEDAFKAIRVDITNIEQCSTQKHNPTRKEKQALKELASNKNIIINKADKRSTIVVRSCTDYIKEGLEYLSDRNTYLELDKDYTQHVAKIVRQNLQQFKAQGLLSPRMAEHSLPPQTLRTAHIYVLKKYINLQLQWASDP